MRKKGLIMDKAVSKGRQVGVKDYSESLHSNQEKIKKIKNKMSKVTLLVDYYNRIGGREIASHSELDDVKSKMEFTQKEILRLCLESKKLLRDAEK